MFAWSGQFSNQAERRGALILCNIVGPSDRLCVINKLSYLFLISHSLPVLLTEGMETPEFWSLLGGKADYSHHSIKNEVGHIAYILAKIIINDSPQIPDYYANSIYLYSNNHFIMKHQLSKSVSTTIVK